MALSIIFIFIFTIIQNIGIGLNTSSILFEPKDELVDHIPLVFRRDLFLARRIVIVHVAALMLQFFCICIHFVQAYLLLYILIARFVFRI